MILLSFVHPGTHRLHRTACRSSRTHLPFPPMKLALQSDAYVSCPPPFGPFLGLQMLEGQKRKKASSQVKSVDQMVEISGTMII